VKTKRTKKTGQRTQDSSGDGGTRKSEVWPTLQKRNAPGRQQPPEGGKKKAQGGSARQQRCGVEIKSRGNYKRLWGTHNKETASPGGGSTPSHQGQDTVIPGQKKRMWEVKMETYSEGGYKGVFTAAKLNEKRWG